MLDFIISLQARSARIVSTKMCVDDFTFSVIGSPQIGFRLFAQATDFAAHVLEDAMLAGLGQEVEGRGVCALPRTSSGHGNLH